VGLSVSSTKQSSTTTVIFGFVPILTYCYILAGLKDIRARNPPIFPSLTHHINPDQFLAVVSHHWFDFVQFLLVIVVLVF
jgi:hypothetical protein